MHTFVRTENSDTEDNKNKNFTPIVKQFFGKADTTNNKNCITFYKINVEDPTTIKIS